MLDGALESVLSFLERGGLVVWILFGVTLSMWTVILERGWYFLVGHPQRVTELSQRWQQRSDHASWGAQSLRQMWLSEASLGLRSGLAILQALVTLCPLLGLLGTVMGMIEVFDVLAFVGTAEPRPMAAGVSRAIIPTMVGMLVALPGLLFSVLFRNRAARASQELGDLLTVADRSAKEGHAHSAP